MLAAGYIGPAAYQEGEAPRHMAAVWSTSDGSSWERIAVRAPQRSSLGPIVRVGSSLLAVGWVAKTSGDVSHAVTWTSADGLNWTLEPVDPALRGVAIGRVLVTSRGLVAFGVDQADGLSRHAGVWLRPFEPAGS
jgi:hypothetical protein